MNDPMSDDTVRKSVGQMRIIVLALVGGATLFGISIWMATLMKFPGKGIAPDMPKVGGFQMLTLLAAATAIVAIIFLLLLPGFWRQQSVDRAASRAPVPTQYDVPQLLAVWQASTLMRAALCEGPAILSFIAFLLNADYAALAIGVVMVAILATGIPSEASARRWLDQALEDLERKRGESTEPK